MDGILLVDKPAGKTSHDVVAAVRREQGGRKGPKVGHAGTLDPFATGLLLVLLGRATRAQRFLMALPKTYEAVARFGAVSSTGDPEGEIVETGAPVPEPLVLPTGVITQRPPAYSAIKVGGERAYRLARRGEEVEVPEREVTVYTAVERWREGERVGIELRCSAGTYVRSYVADLGDAYCEALRRTAIGPFRVEDAGAQVPLADALAAVMPVAEVSGDEARKAGHGVAVVAMHAPADGPVLLVDADGPIAVAEPREGGLLKPTVGFRAG
ncbi:MAG TPA: tRNA pseudouridine(55) synthase TruB [Solirubrobacteraceae bacterium]|nr:tRNA pseudouridine(55) synthase TruB [Solirubrobacteraceae bacterium]